MYLSVKVPREHIRNHLAKTQNLTCELLFQITRVSFLSNLSCISGIS